MDIENIENDCNVYPINNKVIRLMMLMMLVILITSILTIITVIRAFISLYL